MIFNAAHDFAAASTDLRLVLGDDGTLSVDPVASTAYTQLVRGCEPGIDRVLLEPKYAEREMLRRCQLAGVTYFDYGAVALRSLLAEPADLLSWRLLLRWRSVRIADAAGSTIGYAGAVDEEPTYRARDLRSLLASDRGSLESGSKSFIKNVAWLAVIVSAGAWIIGLVFGG